MTENVTMKIRSPLLESFRIEGLNDYKNITLNFEKNVKIIAAENGAGKTTILNALYALLTGKFALLLSINFSRIIIKFKGKKAIIVEKKDIFPQLTKEFQRKTRENRAAREALMFGLTDNELQEMVYLSIIEDKNEYKNCSGFRKLIEDSPLDQEEIKALCNRIAPELLITKKFSEIQESIKQVLNGVSVLYLPTFRRIETVLPEYQRRNSSLRLRHSNNTDDWDADRLIFFGLQDVEHRLRLITNDIRQGMFEAYSRISARTLDQLLAAGPYKTDMNREAMDVATLKVVLARLGKTDSEAEVRIIKLIESGDINNTEHDSLQSFLSQLLEIYQEKREYEQAVENFAKVVDSYWSDPTSKIREKSFSFDKLTVEANAINNYTGLPLPLGALSSGEKQIISIFARLYLDVDKRYLILIDEPELSLSIEWQAKFLPDVLSAPSCEQLIAITHSPFTFDNELDPYAGSLEVSYVKKDTVQ